MKYVYIVCEVNKVTGEIFRVRETFSDVTRAVNRAIALIQDNGSHPDRYNEAYVELLREMITSYINKNGQFWDRGFEAAVFKRQLDSM